jgi:hypothetical protein
MLQRHGVSVYGSQSETSHTFFLLTGLSSVAIADSCGPVQEFVQLGGLADRCLATTRAAGKEAATVFESANECRAARDGHVVVEARLAAMPKKEFDRCARQDQAAYTTAATSLLRLYQLELATRQ